MKFKSISTACSYLIKLVIPPRPTERIVGQLSIQQLQRLTRYDGTLPYHEDVVRALIWELKYYASTKARTLTGELLAERLLIEAEDTIGSLLLIPMPMHSKRRKERGHNQAELLCESALRFLSACSGESAREKVLGGSQTIFSNGLAYNPFTLKRVRATAQQQGLERHQRLENVKNSMEVTNKADVVGRVCIVIDDVTTTGATFAEARRALKAAGASEVRCIALAQS